MSPIKRPRFGAVFLFSLLQYSHAQAFAVPFVSSMQIIPPQTQNRLQGFTGAFPTIRPILRLLFCGASGYAVQPARRWRVYKQAQHLHRYQIPTPRQTLYRSAQPPYYNKVYIRVQRCALLWIHVRRCSITQTMPARRTESTRHFPPGGAARQQERGGQRGTIDGCRRISFSGFRPIANRGQQ